MCICQGQGIPAIDGVDFLANIPKCPDSWHVQNTPQCMELCADMIDTALNAAYAIWPHGSFATKQEIRETRPDTPQMPASASSSADIPASAEDDADAGT